MRFRDESRLLFTLSSSASSGAIFSSTSEYWICALTHEAMGAAATETRKIFSCWKEAALLCNNLRTPSRISGVMLRASKLRMSLMTLPCARNRFMEIQDVSWLFMSRRTPSSTSRIASGGSLRDLISVRLSFLMLPTACLAASSTGWHSLSSASTCTRLPSIPASAAASFDDRSCASCFFLPASSFIDVISCRACSACAFFSFSCFCCTTASLESVSTVSAASSSFRKPPPRKERCC
mmetsp:Transcript_26319/g.63843  ORF Transcript_26319/g.63843 Transcript_26319/m.63843 type:complete len:237 (+) Transcript_26319:4870-5580(+)